MGAEKRKVNLPDDYIARIVDSVTAAVPETESIYIFGSYARGEETPESDVDIYVTTDKVYDRIDFDAMADIGVSIMWMKQERDVICLSSGEFHRRSLRNHSLEDIVSKEGVRIYG